MESGRNSEFSDDRDVQDSDMEILSATPNIGKNRVLFRQSRDVREFPVQPAGLVETTPEPASGLLLIKSSRPRRGEVGAVDRFIEFVLSSELSIRLFL